MAIPGLTIYHVKSHLQKYRMSIFTREEDHNRSKSERRSISEMLPNFSDTSGAQLNEALLIQMEAQRRLSDQLEVQKSLKMKIEAQGRFLDKIMEEYKNRAPSTKPTKPYSPILSLPPLSEESDQSNGKEFESDSEEVDTSEIVSKDEFRAQKRIKIQDNVLPHVHKFPQFNPESQNIGMFSLNAMNNNEQEISFPWNVAAFQSPLMQANYNPLN
ncbi:hypothetical protein CDL12_09753 [Handroanthus impetiginosus]|uniref:MYB-CC type transcription factor LHEQLE-containing domain-containing protein n=1 Tax=Handroanthus impetiginosus TaxID=429701 RepID=A0A2G9HJ62_9LAMI|nr:hypothetical protein CDL12_09753 [Handroanthus impetiginosus]